MFKLYPKQEMIFQTIKDNLLESNLLTEPFLNDKLYLSGEMGVGKTYISSKVIVDYLSNHATYAIVVAPKQVLTKWKKVLSSAIAEYKADIDIIDVTRNTKFTKKRNPIKNKSVLLLATTTLNTFVTKNKSVITQKAESPLVVADEIHTYTGAKLEGLTKLILLDNKKITDKVNIYNIADNNADSSILNNRMKMLLLTGTIFNKAIKDVYQLVGWTHPQLVNKLANDISYKPFRLTKYQILKTGLKLTEYDYSNNGAFLEKSLSNIFSFINRIWRYCSISVSLSDVKETMQNKQEVKQEITPITPLPLSKEEELFIKLANSQLNYIGLSKNRAKMIIMNYLDDPTSSLFIKKNTHYKKSAVHKSREYVIGLPLTPIKLADTKKFKKLTSILKSDGKGHQHVLLYVEDKQLAGKLSTALTKLDYSVYDLANSADKIEDYEDVIKSKFNSDTQIVIVQPSKISEGVDIAADYLIWYQLLTNYSQMLQATRRVYRLNSKQKSQVYFLIYKDTQQEELVDQLSNSAKNNAATYGEQSKDNLTKVTGILLENLK